MKLTIIEKMRVITASHVLIASLRIQIIGNSVINPSEAGCCKNEGDAFDDTCGVPSTSNLFSAGRSYGSINSGRKQWPWMVHIRYTESGENKMRLCGGAIISSRFVLTAAHCLAKIDFPCDNCIHAFVGLYNFRSGINRPINRSRLGTPESPPETLRRGFTKTGQLIPSKRSLLDGITPRNAEDKTNYYT